MVTPTGKKLGIFKEEWFFFCSFDVLFLNILCEVQMCPVCHPFNVSTVSYLMKCACYVYCKMLSGGVSIIHIYSYISKDLLKAWLDQTHWK